MRRTKHLGDLIGLATTFNEPNLPMFLRWIKRDDLPVTTIYGMTRRLRRPLGRIASTPSFWGMPKESRTP